MSRDAFDRTANLLGALSLAVANRMDEASKSAVPHAGNAAVALSAMHFFLDGATLTELAAVIGLSPSGATRLVDRLVEDGAVRRGPGRDGRETLLFLTSRGSHLARGVAGARAGVLADALAPLTEVERKTLEGIISKLLVELIRPPGATRWLCRFCDTEICGLETAECPVTRSAQQRFGSAGVLSGG